MNTFHHDFICNEEDILLNAERSGMQLIALRFNICLSMTVRVSAAE